MGIARGGQGARPTNWNVTNDKKVTAKPKKSNKKLQHKSILLVLKSEIIPVTLLKSYQYKLFAFWHRFRFWLFENLLILFCIVWRHIKKGPEKENG